MNWNLPEQSHQRALLLVALAVLCVVGAAGAATGQVDAGSDRSANTTATATGDISGLVTDSANTRIPNASVTLYREGVSSPVATTTADSQGSFRFSGVRAGDYRVEASVDGTTGNKTVTVVAGKLATANIAITTGGRTTPGNVTGLVKDLGDDGLAGATVTLYPAGESSAIATTTTDSRGAYTFGGVPAGEYRIEASTNNALGSRTTTVVDGKTTTANVVVVSQGEPDVRVLAESQNVSVQPGESFTVTYRYTNDRATASAGRIDLTTPTNITATAVSGAGSGNLDTQQPSVRYSSARPVGSGKTVRSTVTYEVAADHPSPTDRTINVQAYVRNSSDVGIAATTVEVESASLVDQYDTNGTPGIQSPELLRAIVDFNSGNITQPDILRILVAFNAGS
ncbi:carboxypeptidase regulatory-like domain-containing protein [Haloarcula pelagica]|uniref:carboxypeptidase regulatory-like domain-containing protein n=1 Tax=Haloarcula pelagica TaxID=3033389 RepID=UPI0024C2C14B|nr:carboxypeptidase regulatory-like domain-containing protein [Halomicroarcula sp. YJ-61-S]